METVKINKEALAESVKLTNEVNDRVESLQLMGDQEIVEGHNKAKKEIEERDLGEWDEL